MVSGRHTALKLYEMVGLEWQLTGRDAVFQDARRVPYMCCEVCACVWGAQPRCYGRYFTIFVCVW